MLFRRAAKIHILEIGKDLAQKFPVDLVGGDLFVDIDQFQDQTVVCRLGLVAGTGLLNVAQNIVGRNVVAALGEIAFQNAGIFLHILINKLLNAGTASGIHLFGLVGVGNAVGKKLLQHGAVPDLRAAEHLSIQLRDRILFKTAVDGAEIRIGIAGFGRTEVGVMLPLCKEKILHIVGIVFQNADALVIIVAVFQQMGGRIQRKFLLDIFFGIVGAVALQDGVQHVAGIIGTLLAADHQTDTVGVRKIGDLFTLFDQGVVDSLLIIRDDRGDGDIGADVAQLAGSTQSVHGLRDDGRRIDLVDIQLGAVRSIAVGHAAVGILDHNRGGVCLLAVGVQVDQQGAGQRQQENQKTETLQIA